MQNSILDRLDKVDYVSNILYQTDIIITAIYMTSSADESASPCLDLGYIHTGCPTIEYSLCFGCFLSFQSSYREVFYHFLTAQETRIPKLTLLSSLRQKLIKLQSKTWGKLDLDII